jgi:hypothetical protein
MLWQSAIAHSALARMGAAEVTVLGCSVWLAYAADRWIEGCRLLPEKIQTHRHQFYHRWRWPIAAVWIAVLILDFGVALQSLPSREFRAGGLMLFPVAAYLLSHQFVHRIHRWRAPKEVCVAGLLGGGASLFPACHPEAYVPGIVISTSLFVLLCFSNCTLISLWECDVDRSQGQTSLALQFVRAPALIRALPWALFLLSATAWTAFGPKVGAALAFSAASSLLLGLIDHAEVRIGRIPARVLADVALMTPLIPLLARILA